MRTKLQALREELKTNICAIITDTYKRNNNGLLPNWENDEEVVISEDLFENNNYIHVAEGNTYDESLCIIEEPITEYKVTLDYNLYFGYGEDGEEVCWQEVGTDDLLTILEFLTINTK